MILTRGHAFKPSGFYESISPKASAGRPKRKRLNHSEPVSKNSPGSTHVRKKVLVKIKPIVEFLTHYV